MEGSHLFRTLYIKWLDEIGENYKVCFNLKHLLNRRSCQKKLSLNSCSINEPGILTEGGGGVSQRTPCLNGNSAMGVNTKYWKIYHLMMDLLKFILKST